MRKQLLFIWALAALTAVPGMSYAGKDRSGKDAWIHIEVIEHDGDHSKVNVNLPVSLADVALNMAHDQDVLSDGHVKINGHDEVSVSDLRRMWAELKKAGDAEFVTVEGDDENVKIYRKGDQVFVNVDDKDSGGGKPEQVRIEMPVRVVDALLRGEGEDLDLSGALAELKDMDGGEILRVEGGDEHVRIWVD